MVSQKIRNCVRGLRDMKACGHLTPDAFELGMDLLLQFADEVECMEETPVPPRHRYTGQEGVIDLLPFLKANGCRPLRLPQPPAQGDAS